MRHVSLQPQLQQIFGTSDPVYLSTSSAWGVMEGAIRNLVQKKVLNCMCGAFSDKWLDVSKKCGKEAEALQVDWGSPIRAEQVDAALLRLAREPIEVVVDEDDVALRDRAAGFGQQRGPSCGRARIPQTEGFVSGSRKQRRARCSSSLRA